MVARAAQVRRHSHYLKHHFFSYITFFFNIPRFIFRFVYTPRFLFQTPTDAATPIT